MAFWTEWRHTIAKLKVGPQIIVGSRFTVGLDNWAAADVARQFWVAPAACKVVEVHMRWFTKAGVACLMGIEKLVSGEAAGAGDPLLATGIDVGAANNVPLSEDAVMTAAATLAAGDALALDKVSGTETSLVNATVTVLMEWV